MISRAQQILIKRAQREARLDDADYREALQAAAGCRSSKDPGMTDRGVDLFLAYLEAIYWRKRDAGELQDCSSHNAVFRQRGYWKEKNPRQNTSRDRYNGSGLVKQLGTLEADLSGLGLGPEYCAAVRRKVIQDRSDDRSLLVYAAALRRTLNAKRAKLTLGNNNPF